MARSMQATTSSEYSRAGQIRLGVWIEALSLAWMVIEASIAITAGLMARSVSLEGFGFDSIVELVAGGVLLWRLLVEQRGSSLASIERAERRAAWITAISLFTLALYIVANSGFSLLTRSHPQVSWWGIGLAIAAAIIMPLLWQGKLRVARRIGSAALKADAVCSVTCAYMSFALLIGLLLNTLFGLWWADSLAALVLVYFIVQEGREALHEARTGETCSCGDEDCL
ncbi:MAG: cation transporter [Ktedonobacteraceae bacterium]